MMLMHSAPTRLLTQLFSMLDNCVQKRHSSCESWSVSRGVCRVAGRPRTAGTPIPVRNFADSPCMLMPRPFTLRLQTLNYTCRSDPHASLRHHSVCTKTTKAISSNPSGRCGKLVVVRPPNGS